jgi:hypothetical protein
MKEKERQNSVSFDVNPLKREGKWQILYFKGRGRKNNILLEGLQASPARPSYKGSV